MTKGIKLTIKIEDYLLTYGKNPKGRGSWAFFFDSHPEPWFAYITHETGLRQSSMLYSEALKLAKQEAKNRNAHVITVAT